MGRRKDFIIKTILTYLERPNCLECLKATTNNNQISHCSSCQNLFDLALSKAKSLMNLPLYELAQKAEEEKEIEKSLMKSSHNWQSQMVPLDDQRTKYARVGAHCKTCGITLESFKYEPKYCSK